MEAEGIPIVRFQNYDFQEVGVEGLPNNRFA